MEAGNHPRIAKWPFFLGDVLMLGLAGFIFWQRPAPLPWPEILAGSFCVFLGAVLAATPFVLEHRGMLKALAVDTLGSAIEKIQNLETLSAHIGSATSHWQLAHEDAEKTSAAAREISQGMARELQDFKEFIAQTNDSERATLRLEVEKLRRAETDWLQTLVRIMDHIHALNHAAERSGQPQVASQINSFQNACRETARKVGLVPFVAAAGDKFDSKRHQVAGGTQPPEGAVILESLAPGYTFQGRALRPALVKLPAGSPESQARVTHPPAGPASEATTGTVTR